jgi:succinyl-diaminopimelate desuccinylase
VTLDLTADPIALTQALVDIESVSGNERELADQVEAAVRALGRFEVLRDGEAVLARTNTGKPRRILLAGHLDTVPTADNVPSTVDGDRMYGCGTSDMKSGVALMLHAAAVLAEPAYDLTLVFYDCEEIEADRNGLGRISRTLRDWLDCDLAVVLEPTSGQIEGGCQGTMRALVTATGTRAHSARSWLGSNAIHAAGEILARLSTYEARVVPIDGCTYREGLNAVFISGGVAGNIVPDQCTVTVNYRFAPDRDEKAAAEHMKEVFAGFDVQITDSAPSAPPGLSAPAAQAFVAAIGGTPVAKYGWTDVGRFATLGIPAVNFGPGDPNMAHKRDEYVDMPKITTAAEALVRFLAG